jgi:uncharacterized protein YegP (UPF0339 family)
VSGDYRCDIWEAADGWRFRFRAGNGEIVSGGEAYTRRRDAVRAAKALKSAIWRAVVV